MWNSSKILTDNIGYQFRSSLTLLGILQVLTGMTWHPFRRSTLILQGTPSGQHWHNKVPLQVLTDIVGHPYRSPVTLQGSLLLMCHIYFSALGEGWAPVLMDNNHERNFITAAQRGINDTRSYWIGGTARWLASTRYDPVPGTPGNWLDDTISMIH